MKMTIGQLFEVYDGKRTTCQETEAILSAEYPGWTLDTEVDVKEYLNHHKKHDKSVFALVSVFKYLNEEQKKELAKWSRNLLKDKAFTDEKDKEKHDHLKGKDDEHSVRVARQLLVKEGKATDSEVLDKCIELLGL